MLSRVNTASLLGIKGELIYVETDITKGLPTFNLVGLPDRTIKESSQRIKSAIKNSGYGYPNGRITINLSPANKVKKGSHFDLAIAVGILAAQMNIKPELLLEVAVFGELSLNGTVKKIIGALPLVVVAIEKGSKTVIIPKENFEEVSLIKGITVFPVEKLDDVIKFFINKVEPVARNTNSNLQKEIFKIDFNEVYGQENVKRALVICAAGGHGIFMIGSPGVGKTMLAKRINTILPPLSYSETLELTKIYSVKGLLNEITPYIFKRPFRAPQSSISKAGLLGGGVEPIPGEFSLAHRGVLFLDELGEYDSRVIDALRKPIEDGRIIITRKNGNFEYPGKTILVCASNPCKCGYLWDEVKKCTCTDSQISNYQSKFTGSILDRIDLHVRVNSVSYKEIKNKQNCKSSKELREDVLKAREVQKKRYIKEEILLNSELDTGLVDKYCKLGNAEEEFLALAYKKMGLSMRTYIKIIKLSRTIADIDECEEIGIKHLSEALQYRSFDEKYKRL